MATKILGKVAFSFEGDYAVGTTYKKKSVVFDGESSYISITDNNKGNALSDTTKWKYLCRGSSALSQQNAADIVKLGSDLSKIPDNLEPALAELLNHLLGRISALESIIKNSTYKNMQVDSLDIVKTFNIYGGTNLILTGTSAPAIVPDFIGQFFVNTTGGVIYQANGNGSVSDWKQTSN